LQDIEAHTTGQPDKGKTGHTVGTSVPQRPVADPFSKTVSIIGFHTSSTSQEMILHSFCTCFAQHVGRHARFIDTTRTGD
jgi:hypothetical protein